METNEIFGTNGKKIIFEKQKTVKLGEKLSRDEKIMNFRQHFFACWIKTI